MRNAGSAGRLVGGLIIAQMVGGALVNFVLAAPLFGSPGFLVSASPHASQIGWSVLLGVALGALTVGIAVTICLLARDRAPALALWLLALATASLAAAVAEQISVMSMLSLSEAYANAPTAEQGGFQGLRTVVASARNWSHFIGLGIAGSTIFVMYATLYRAALVPRALAAFGMAAAILQVVVVLVPLFGHSVVFLLLAPLGVSQLALATWLIVRGFPDPTVPAGESGA